MMEQIFRKPNNNDLEYLINNIRPIDQEEIYALSGGTVEQALSKTPNLLDNSQVWEVDGKVTCMFGVNPFPEYNDVGVIWMIATKEFDKHRVQFARQCRKVVNELISNYTYLFNYIYEKHEVSIQWLKSLGFTIQDKEPIGFQGANFHRFEMLRDV